MKLKYALPLAALALTGIGAQVAQAQEGTDPTASAKFKSKLVRVDRSTAVLKVKYQCSNGKAKKSLTKEGSSQVARTWVQSHRNPITCDGASHTQVFTLDKVEPGSKGRLKAKGKHNAGKAYIQFCVTLPGATEQDTELTLSESGFVSVR